MQIYTAFHRLVRFYTIKDWVVGFVVVGPVSIYFKVGRGWSSIAIAYAPERNG